jgi:Uma2 family endonuclease
MLAAESLPRMSVSDYLAFEQDSEIRHELVDGYLYCDRGDKRLAYQGLSSLQEYMLVARDEPSIEIYRRTKAGWSRSSIGVSRR